MRLLFISILLFSFVLSHSEQLEWSSEDEEDQAPEAGEVFDNSKLVFLMEYGRHSSRFVEI